MRQFCKVGAVLTVGIGTVQINDVFAVVKMLACCCIYSVDRIDKLALAENVRFRNKNNKCRPRVSGV